MRRVRGKTWLSFAATLLLAAVISPMADATDVRGAEGAAVQASTGLNARMTQSLTRTHTTIATTGPSSKPTDLIARVDSSSPLLTSNSQIPVGATGGVYYDTRQAQSEPSATADEKAPLFGIVTPGKWTSLLSTVLLVGFLFLRRAS